MEVAFRSAGGIAEKRTISSDKNYCDVRNTSLGASIWELSIQSAEEIAEHEEETAITMDVGDTTVCGGVVNCMLNIPPTPP